MNRTKLRKSIPVSYYQPNEPAFDEYVYCESCCDFVFEYCSIHGPLLIIPDDQTPKTSEPHAVPRSALTVPSTFLHLAPSMIPGAGVGVFATLTLPRGVRFGPYRGLKTQQVNSMYCWQVQDDHRKPSHFVDAGDADASNWLRYVNCARHRREQNLVAFQYQGQIYYRTVKVIPRQTELLVFYGSKFAVQLGIDLHRYNSDGYYHEILNQSATKTDENLPIMRSRNDASQNIFSNSVVAAQNISIANNEPLYHPNNEVPIENFVYIDKIAPHYDGKNIEQNDTSAKNQTDFYVSLNGTNDAKTGLYSYNDVPYGDNAAITGLYGCNNVQYGTNEVETGLYGNDVPREKNGDITGLYGYNNEPNGTNEVETTLYGNDVPREKNGDITGSYGCNNEPNGTNGVETSLYNYNAVPNGSNAAESGLYDNTGFSYGMNAVKTGFCGFNQVPYGTNAAKTGLYNSHDVPNGTVESKYVCTVCNKSYMKSYNLKRHILGITHKLVIQKDVNSFVCKICSFQCANVYTYNRHIKIHVMKTCPVCGKQFSVKISHHDFKRHVYRHKRYSCSKCAFETDISDAFDRHLRGHDRDKTFECDHCPYVTNKRKNLVRHLKKLGYIKTV